MVYCARCGCKCKGNMRIELRKGNYSPFCKFCFNVVQFKELREIRKIIKTTKQSI